MNIAAVSASMVAAGIGGGLARLTGSSRVALYLASVLLIAGGVLALRLPGHVDEAPQPGAGRAGAAKFRLSATAPVVTGPLASALALRMLAGLLTIFLAFLLRADHAGALVLGSVFGAAAAGQLGGTAVAARVPERAGRVLSLVALALPFATCLMAALSGSTAWTVASAGATGAATSLSKFALDAALQRHVRPHSLSTAFARSETGLQLAWVLGGGLALVLPTTETAGFAAAAALPVLGVVGAWQLAVRSRRDGGRGVAAEVPRTAM
jgi:TRAP-type C4-dicarboxylate transport system permease small subunit